MGRASGRWHIFHLHRPKRGHKKTKEEDGEEEEEEEVEEGGGRDRDESDTSEGDSF
ncbi:hypothetical protein JOB18_008019 [Solea senegalensis]|uniref:Uncharacterized protein n=1 Tax=Solea senegalensis TaxID=28829 RepID=A0AAV6SA43_SOLSE|nr:hypothetical protein JOB18_008019 [Solea senegalensis]